MIQRRFVSRDAKATVSWELYAQRAHIPQKRFDSRAFHYTEVKTV